MVIVQNILIVCDKMMSAYLHLGSVGHERQQQAKVAACGDADSTANCREYAVKVAASCNIEMEAYARLRSLFFQEELWILMMHSGKDNAHRSLAHRSISSAGSSVFHYCLSKNLSFPTALFRIIDVPAMAATIRATPPCMLDSATLEIFNQHESLNEPLARAKVIMLALVLVVTSAKVECGWAWINRLLGMRPQTWGKQFEDISADWVCSSMNNSQSDVVAGAEPPTPADESAAPGQASVGPPNPYAGGTPFACRSRHPHSARYLAGGF